MILTIQRYITTVFYTLLSLAFLLYGMHSKDLASLSSASSAPGLAVDAGVIARDEGGKLMSDLHHHMDKQTFKSLMKYSSETMIQMETRMLEMHKTYWRRAHKYSALKLWLEYARIKFSFLARALYW